MGKDQRIKLSVVLAVYNEEKNLLDCLDSIKNLADEIVVVDGGSTDKTAEIAEKFGAKVKITDNPPIFHINKQKAIDLATGDWVLQLDADEKVTDRLKEEILKAVGKWEMRDEKWDSKVKSEKLEDKIVAYWIPRKNYFLSRWMKKTGMYPDPVIRLFKKGKAYLPCKSVHEQMVIDGKVDWLKNELLHYPYTNFSEYLKKSNHYTTLTAMEYKEKKLGMDWLTRVKYLKILPCLRFLELYFRHKGFMDGFPGLVFSFYSALHIKTSYIKYWEMVKKSQNL